MQLSTDQKKVSDMFEDFVRNPNESEMVIKGYPGCGKSFLTKYLIDVVKNSNKIRNLISPRSNETKIHCTATTNKAAEVLSKAANHPAGTIHSLLGLKVYNNINTGKTSLKKTNNYSVISNSIVFIDEASQEDTPLMNIVRESTKDCKTVHIGDPYQLTNITEKICPAFKDIKLQGELTSSQRFSATGPIADLASQMRYTIDTGIFKDIIPDGKTIIHCDGPTFQKEVETEFTRPDFQENDAKVLSYTNAMVNSYNSHIRGLFYPTSDPVIGEKVITNKPIEDMNNPGNILLPTEFSGTITDVVPGNEFGIDGHWITLNNRIQTFQPVHQYFVKQLVREEAKRVNQSKGVKNWRMYFFYQSFFSDLRPIYASTVYKSQGSTYKNVYINLTDIGRCRQHYVVARMLHVAITRASDKVFLYGELPFKYKGDYKHNV